MKEKFDELVARRNVDELQRYFAALPEGHPLDFPEEKALLEKFDEPSVKVYIERFPLSDKALKIFLMKASRHLIGAYINRHGLSKAIQKFVIDKDLVEVALEFTKIHSFDNVNYLLDMASDDIIRLQVSKAKLVKDEQVLKLLHHENGALFIIYVNRGFFISDCVIKAVIEESKDKAFTAIVHQKYRAFKKLVNADKSIDEIRAEYADEALLSAEMQLLVLQSAEQMLIEPMLKTMPLCPKAQQYMLSHKFSAEWFALHVSHLYGVGGYRFVPEYEEGLFKILACKELDDCLVKFRQQDEKSFVRYASAAAVIKYIKNFWLTDEAQVLLIRRGNVEVTKAFIARFSPEHGMCWQAEVELVKKCSPEIIKLYIDIHTMCREALEQLRRKSEEVFSYYFSKHYY